MSTQQHTYADDLMDLADAVGVSSRALSIDELPIPFLLVVDHASCEGGDCEATICACSDGRTCRGALPQGCTHHLVLCEDCRTECTDCRLDAAYDDSGWDR